MHGVYRTCCNKQIRKIAVAQCATPVPVIAGTSENHIGVLFHMTAMYVQKKSTHALFLYNILLTAC